MLNLFTMHMYRALKAKSSLVLGIIMVAFMFATFGLAFIIFDDPLKLGIGAAYTQMMVGEGSGNISAAGAHHFMIQSNDAFIICLTIFAVIFANCDFSRGFVKNTYGMFEHRWKQVWSKWTAMTACVSIAYAVCSMLGIALCLGLLKNSQFGDASQLLRSLGVVYLCLIAMMTMVFFITNLFKSPAGGMVIGLIIATGILQTGEMILDLLIAKLSGADMNETVAAFAGIGEKTFFRISDYCLDNVYLSYTASMGTSDTIRTVAVALVHMALFLGLSMLLSEKRDVRC
ncbi:MAG: ABC transporter permease [Clostridiales bacterium]|nr:ABC transporter permease [Clostridiales bacterium]